MDERRARERREFIWNNHPDRGGDGHAFIAGLADFDRPERPDRSVRVVAVARLPLRLRLLRMLRGGRRRVGPRRLR